MAAIKSYSDLQQSRKLAEILSHKSADMYWYLATKGNQKAMFNEGYNEYGDFELPCWSLAALLKYLSEIKPKVYTPVIFPSEGKWILQFAEHGHGNVCEVSCDNSIDACYEVIIKLYELKML